MYNLDMKLFTFWQHAKHWKIRDEAKRPLSSDSTNYNWVFHSLL